MEVRFSGRGTEKKVDLYVASNVLCVMCVQAP